MTTTKILDAASNTEITGCIRFVTVWADSTEYTPAALSDAEAAQFCPGTSRETLVAALRVAASASAGRTATVYVRDSACADSDDAWWWAAKLSG